MTALRYVLIATLIGLFSLMASALTEAEIESRAKDIGRSLRCVVCQNQSIDESDAPLAADMRASVRAQLAEGKTEAEILAFMQNRYGDFVLLKPPVKPSTYLLWGLPFLCVAGFAVLRLRRRPIVSDEPPLTAQERDALARLESEI